MNGLIMKHTVAKVLTVSKQLTAVRNINIPGRLVACTIHQYD